MSDGLHAREQLSAFSRRRGGPTIGERLRDLSSLAVFIGELISNPRQIGAPIPSSRVLARHMASFIPRQPSGHVIELGPGTGAITSALLDRGVPAHKLVLIERSYEMTRILRKKFPGVKVILGDAAEMGKILSKHLDPETDRVGHVVSSLPLRSLPRSVVEAIARELHHVLGREGRFIQYTYDVRPREHEALRRFRRSRSRMVWLNLPPARVDVYHPPAPRAYP